MKDRTVDDFALETNDVMTEFFQRSVKQNLATGIPQPFEYQVDVAELKGQSFKEERAVVAETLPQKVVSPPVPTITDCFPNNGKKLGGTTAGIQGTQFLDTARVFFNDIEATEVVFHDSTFLQCKTPATPISGFSVPATIKVTNVPNIENEATDLFTYFGHPNVTSVAPNHASGAGGNVVSVLGFDFAFSGGYKVQFQGVYCSTVNRISSTELQVVIPAHSEGLVDVTVTAPDFDHQTSTLHNGFTYDLPAGAIPTHWFSLNNPVNFPHIYRYSGFFAGPFNLYAFTQNWVFDPTYNGILDTLFAHFSSNMESVTYSQNIQFINGVASVSFRGVRGPLTGFGHSGEYELYAGIPVPNGYSNFLCYATAVDPVYSGG